MLTVNQSFLLNSLQQANVVTIDAVTRILSETVSAIEDYHSQYRLGGNSDNHFI